ncbi:MAG: hypothetical protein IT491_16235 [Gammaproteobacteria bacterium]|nr:hypothetical protein [Gammaproteobacteria bacterium]
MTPENTLKNPSAATQNQSSPLQEYSRHSAPMAAPKYSVRDVLSTLFRERRLILWVFLVTFGIGAVISFKLGILYTAEARILILPSRQYVLNSDVGELTNNFGMGDERIIRSETEILKNSTLVEQVIKIIGVDRLYPAIKIEETPGALGRWLGQLNAWLFGSDHEESSSLAISSSVATAEHKQLNQAVVQFTSKLEILPVKDASVIFLAFSHPNPALATEALNSLILGYLNFRTSVFGVSRSKIFIEQRDSFSQRFGKLEQDIEAFKLKNGISAFADQKSLLLRQQAEINNNRMDSATRFKEVEGRIEILRKQLTLIPKNIPLFVDNSTNQDSGDVARATLVTLETRRNELLTKFNENSEFVTDMNEQIAKLKQIVAAALPKKSDSQRVGRNTLYDEINADFVKQESTVAALRAKHASLEQQFATVSSQLIQFDQMEKQFNALILERELLEKNLRIYAQKVEEALVQEEIDRQKMANVRIIESPQVPRQAKNLRKVILIFSLLAAGLIALVLAFFKDFFRQVVITPEDAERSLGLPVLMAIPAKQ